MLLLHGWPQHSYEWRKVVPLLADRYRLLMPDHRGFGRSEAPRGGYHPETFASDALALLDVLGIDRVVLVGHDWGGFTALLLALWHPQRFSRVLAMSTPHPWAAPSARAVRGMWRAWYAGVNALPVIGRRAVASAAYVPSLLGDDVFTYDEIEAYAAPLRERDRALASSRLYRAYWRMSAEVIGRSRFADARLEIPARLLFGREDRMIPTAYVDGPEGPAHGLEVELVPGASHWLPEERPELVAARAAAP